MNDKKLELLKNVLKWNKEKLTSDIDLLINTLQEESKRLKEDENYLPNGLGVIQSIGQSIDNRCGQIEGQQKAIEIMDGSSPLL